MTVADLNIGTAGSAADRQDLAWRRRLIWAAVALATLALAIGPDLFSFTPPPDTLVLDHAIFEPEQGASRPVSLPHAVFVRTDGNMKAVRYRFELDLQDNSRDLFVLVPSVNRSITLAINGQTIFDSTAFAVRSGPLLTAAYFARMPKVLLHAGHNQLTMTVATGLNTVPTYISAVYVGSEASLAASFRLLDFLVNTLKTTTMVANVLLALGFIFLSFFRPKDQLFGWLTAFLICNLVFALVTTGGWISSQSRVPIFGATFLPAMSLFFVGVAYAIIHKPAPKFLLYAAVGITLALQPFAVIGTTPARAVVAITGLVFVVVLFAATTGIIAWAAFRIRSTEACILLPASLLLTYYVYHDTFVAATVPNYGFTLLVPYCRPFFLGALTFVLMRRMALSLDQLDHANETLNIKLAEREAELAKLHRREQEAIAHQVRESTTHLVRDQERQRLTHDLHDGISGHLVSIIALSERTGDKNTEQAAREALNDLRLVIYSLDLGDRELPLALANLRERLVPQLQRLGVALDWSIAGLPDISGVTPGNALAVLRIMQEAITNALKHGPARAQQLRGKVAIESIDGGVRLTLLLPLTLPDFEEET
jgi:two-component system sensor histidine kinase UhpB